MRLLVFSHFTDKLKINQHLRPPSVEMLRTTILSACYYGGIRTEGGLLVHDEAPGCSWEREVYTGRVMELARQFGMEFMLAGGQGYRNAFLMVAEKWKKDFGYYFWLEHDWWFHSSINVQDILSFFCFGSGSEDWSVDYVKVTNYHDETERFKTPPHPCPHFEQDKDRRNVDSESGVMQDSLWSTNPHIGRISALVNKWKPIVEAVSDQSAVEANGKAGGLDEVLCTAYLNDIRSMGFDQAHRKWGVWLALNNGTFNRVCEHMGI